VLPGPAYHLHRSEKTAYQACFGDRAVTQMGFVR
jgi:hypothetical protein